MMVRSFAILVVASTLSFQSAMAEICTQIHTCSPSEIAAATPECRAAIEFSCQRAELQSLKMANAELEAMVGELKEETASQAKMIGGLVDLVRKLKRENRRANGRR